MVEDPATHSRSTVPIPGLRTIGIGVVIDRIDGAPRVLISRRQAGAVLAGYWEFPGGKVEAGESVERAIERELREELGIEVETVRGLSAVEHVYAHGAVRLVPYLCSLRAGSASPRALQVAEWRWVLPSELSGYRFPEANAGLIAEVVAVVSGDAPGALHPET